MNDKPQFEIPDAVREMAERNVEQTRAAYQKFVDMARQAQSMVASSQGAMAQNAMEIQSRAMKFAEKNIDSNFDFATRLARARDVREYLEIQTQYAQSQMKVYAEQAQELGKLMADAAQAMQPKR